MQIVVVLVIAALVFGICFLVDKGFAKVFRGQEQHKSGKAVRLNKRYGSLGLILLVLGVAAIFSGISSGWVMIAGGAVLLAVGGGLVVYYLSFGIFYDTDSFLVSTLGKKSRTYFYRDIRNQQLYNNQGYLLIELYMSDGQAVQVQSTMPGAFDFMDHAYGAWLRQTGRREEDCAFHDPANSCWFPPVEG